MTEEKIVPQELKGAENQQSVVNVTALPPVAVQGTEQVAQAPEKSEIEHREESLAKREAEIAKKEAELAKREAELSSTNASTSELSRSAQTETVEIVSVMNERLANRVWKAEYEAVVGLKHRKPIPPQPCQDAAFAGIEPKPMVITADGAGSSITSDIGSQRVVTGVRRLIDTLYFSQFSALDKTDEIAAETYQRWALILVKHAKGILEDLATEYRRPIKDFRCTLLTAIVGNEHTFWFKVGDGALVVERLIEQNGEPGYALQHIGEVGKGEHANETTFIDENLSKEAVDFGILDSRNITAIFSMSDGAAFKCVSNDGAKVAGSLSDLARDLREGKLQRTTLTKFFYSEPFLANHDGDDCSMAIIAR